MHFVEFKRQLDELTGQQHRGWKRLAAEKLGVTERALYDAEKRGEAGPVMVRALRAAQERAKDWSPLADEAVRWVIGEPEVEKGDDVEAQVAVVHLHEPRFTALFRFMRDGTIQRLVAEHGEAEARTFIDLVQVAELKAEARMRAERARSAKPETDAKPSANGVKRRRRRLSRSDIERIRAKPKTKGSGRGPKPEASKRSSGKETGGEESGEVSEADAGE